jgi:hypothetical protein
VNSTGVLGSDARCGGAAMPDTRGGIVGREPGSAEIMTGGRQVLARQDRTVQCCVTDSGTCKHFGPHPRIPTERDVDAGMGRPGLGRNPLRLGPLI